MSATNFPDYARQVQDLLDRAVAAADVVLVRIEIDARSALHGQIGGLVRYHDGSELHFREYVDTSQRDPRLMYAYHYQAADTALIFRYDNAAHRPPLPQAEHKHTAAGVQPGPAPTLEQVMDEILGSP